MAYLEDLSDEERQRLLAGGTEAPQTGGVGGAPVSAGAPGAAPQSSGFVNLSRYFDVNKDQAQAQGAEMAGKLEESANASLQGDDPGKAMETYGQIDAAATPGGLASVIKKDDDPQYSSGMAGLDAYLGVRGSEPGKFEGLRGLYGDRLRAVEPGQTYKPPSQGLSQWSASQQGMQAFKDWDKATRDYIAWRVRRDKNATGAELDPEALYREAYGHEVRGSPWENPAYWGGGS